jgi:hypothetical protein
VATKDGRRSATRAVFGGVEIETVCEFVAVPGFEAELPRFTRELGAGRHSNVPFVRGCNEV